MTTKEKYQVLWKCPHCGNEHTWWWEDKWEAYDEGVTDMLCDRCEKRSRHKGDGWGFYTCVDDVESNTDKLNEKIKDLYVGLNALTKRVIELENQSLPKPKAKSSFIDLIHGEKPPFVERFREGCGYTEGTMSGEDVSKILRFIAVEVERMTERGMGGSFTVSNLTVGKNLRELADEAEIEN